MRNLLLFTAVFFSAFSRADDCSPIRLDETAKVPGWGEIEGAMVHVAIRDQHEIGSCYAHASAQMYDAWRFRHGKFSERDYADFSSGFWVGLRFKIDENAKIESSSRIYRGSGPETDIDGGVVERVLPYLLREGTCSQRILNGVFRSELRDAPGSEGLNVDTYASQVMEKFERYQRRYFDGAAVIGAEFRAGGSAESRFPTGPRASADHTRVDPRSFDAQVELRKSSRIDVLKRAILAEGVKELRAYNESVLSDPEVEIPYEKLRADSNTVKMFETLGVIDCPEATRLMAGGEFAVRNTKTYVGDGPFGLGRRAYHPDRFKATVNAELDRGLVKAYPIGVAYCASIFDEGRAFKSKDYGDAACRRHASLIIGRRRDPKDRNRCQFLIRNSWGRSCSSYHPDWDCEASRGSVWVDADVLGLAANRLQTMETIRD